MHALTDVTGFGLLGHTLEMARGANLTAHLDSRAIPFLPNVIDLASSGIKTGASGRNWASYGAGVDISAGAPPLPAGPAHPTRRQPAACWWPAPPTPGNPY